MIGLAILALVIATMSVGVYMGLRHLRRLRNRPSVIGLHFILGALTLEPLVVVLRGAPNGAGPKPTLLGVLGAIFIMLALFSGVMAVMIGRKSRQTANVALATHAGVATTAFLLLAAWALAA
jgi:uncharacterized membrane protein YozB (DUF420 family)